MDQSELLGLLGSSHNYVQNLYMEPVKEVPTNWYLFTNGNSTLQSINLPQATKIGYNAFNKCTGLTSIDLPKVTEIGNRAFAGCTGLTSINLPQVTNIGIGAFVGCGKLASIYLPQVTDIREDAFFGCTGLKSIVLSGTGTENSFALPTYDTQNGLGNYNFSPENLFLTGVTALEDDQITQCRTWGKMTWANIYYNYKGSPSLAEATITELTNPENYTKVTDK